MKSTVLILSFLLLLGILFSGCYNKPLPPPTDGGGSSGSIDDGTGNGDTSVTEEEIDSLFDEELDGLGDEDLSDLEDELV